MGEISFIYLVSRAGYRILDFFQHWYLGGFLAVRHLSLNILERLDRFFALKITWKYLFQPLYQDYSIIGYLWGFIFRGLRLLAGSLVYGVLILAFSIFYLIWAAIPIYLIYRIFSGF